MEFTEPLIHTALLGTDKRQLKKEDVPAHLATTLELIEQSALYKEESFLQVATILANYRKCGVMPLHEEAITITKAETEERAYANATTHQVLKDILAEESPALVGYWLQVCDHFKLVVQPELIPALLELGAKHKVWQPLVISCTGKRGEWLSSFNHRWQFNPKESEDELWHRGTGEQRRQVLQTLRAKEPAKAREWLQEAWPQENANTKANLLGQLSINVSNEDKEWLESLLTEKSSKVKEVALELLKRIPTSEIVQQYRHLVQQAVRLRKEKGLLGIGSKENLEIHSLSNEDEAIFKSGIEKLSNLKEFTDDEFIIYQLMQSVPPVNWETHLGKTPEEIIQLFKKGKDTKKYLPAITQATLLFKDAKWALALAQYSDDFYAVIVPLLPASEWNQYSLKYAEQYGDEIIQLALQRSEEWSMELAKVIFKHAAKNPYGYHRSFWTQHIQYVPIAATAELEKATPSEEYLKNMWSTTSEYIMKLLTLKLETLKAFQS